MPRKTKDVGNEINENTMVAKKMGTARRAPTKSNKSTNSKSDVKKTSTSKKGATKTKSTQKVTTTKKSTTSKKSSLEIKKDITTVKTTKSSSKKSEVSTTSKDNSKATSTKKTAPKVKKEISSNGRAMLAPTKKSTSNKKKGVISYTGISTNRATAEEILEYYDLPYRYDETTVKILAQTPKKLFIYWDISDDDRKKYIDEFGLDFFNNTKPVLLVHNDSMNYTFEVEINDFANCWYLDITDTKCKYTIELGRRSKTKNYNMPNNYMYITSSNVIENPNDHILFERQSKTVYFRNVKNNTTHSKDISRISFIRNMGKIYNIYDAYKELYSKIYNDEDIIDINNPTSTFK